MEESRDGSASAEDFLRKQVSILSFRDFRAAFTRPPRLEDASVSASTSFEERYGRWAVVAGASEGVGREIARLVAAKGVPCVLLARREAPLRALADEIRRESGVDCVAASVDLAAPDALDRILSAVGSREVGLYIANAGADPNGAHFLDRKIETWDTLLRLNVTTTMHACHHFGGLMRERRRGGLLLVGSGAAFGGASKVAVYSGAKAFGLRFGESLWSELRPYGVDVLSLVLAATDTPALRRLLEEKGQSVPSWLASPTRIAEVGLERLPHGPVYSWGPLARLRAAISRGRVLLFTKLSERVFGPDAPA
jgi:short-subunit dehydrogenase